MGERLTCGEPVASCVGGGAKDEQGGRVVDELVFVRSHRLADVERPQRKWRDGREHGRQLERVGRHAVVRPAPARVHPLR